MTGHRYEACADIVPGEREMVVGGSRIQLIRLTLTDAGPVTRPDGSDYERPDVICPLRSYEARALASRLIELADQAHDTPTPPR